MHSSTEKLQLLGDFVPGTPTGALPLYLTRELSSLRSPKILSQNVWFPDTEVSESKVCSLVQAVYMYVERICKTDERGQDSGDDD